MPELTISLVEELKAADVLEGNSLTDTYIITDKKKEYYLSMVNIFSL